jgi:hypothetical protein
MNMLYCALYYTMWCYTLLQALVDEIIGTLVEKAQSETHFAAMYAKLCLRLSEARLPAFQDEKVSVDHNYGKHYCYSSSHC